MLPLLPQQQSKRHATTTPIRMLLLLLLSVLCTTPFTTVVVNAVLRGDEQYASIPGGRFWVFTSEGISIVDPETCDVEHSFAVDHQGAALPRKWSQGVYMEVAQAQQLNEPPDENAPPQGYILINAGENKATQDSTVPEQGEVIVLSTASDAESPVQTRIPVGPTPGHAYAIYNQNQFWTHSQGDGFFYVIQLDDEVVKNTGHPIRAKLQTFHHGDLLWEIGVDPDDPVGSAPVQGSIPIGYATSEAEPHLFFIDMQSHKQLDGEPFYDFSKDVQINGTCKGASSMAYSKLNQHLYIECYPSGGILEYDVSLDLRRPNFVAQHSHIGGILYETADQRYVSATDKGSNVMTFFLPGQTTEMSTSPIQLTIPGHPEAPSYYYNPSKEDHIACMPLTQMTNAKLVLPDDPSKAVCDYYNKCSPADSLEDAMHGMCRYAGGEGSQGLSQSLWRVQQDAMQDVRDENLEYESGFCGRCQFEDNYNQGTSNACTCTPFCGSCAPDAYPTSQDDIILKTTGVMCLDVKMALLGIAREAALVEGAGAVRHKAVDDDGPECGFQEPVRHHRVGANHYDASISTIPTNAVVIVDMRVMNQKCQAKVQGEPQQIVYVPTANHYRSNNNNNDNNANGGSSPGVQVSPVATALMVVVVLIVVLAVGVMCISSVGFARPTRDNSVVDQDKVYQNGIEMPARIPGEDGSYHDDASYGNHNGNNELRHRIPGDDHTPGDLAGSYHDRPPQEDDDGENGVFT